MKQVLRVVAWVAFLGFPPHAMIPKPVARLEKAGHHFFLGEAAEGGQMSDSEQEEATDEPLTTIGEVFDSLIYRYQKSASLNMSFAILIDQQIEAFGPDPLGQENRELWQSILNRLTAAKQLYIQTATALEALAATLSSAVDGDEVEA